MSATIEPLPERGGKRARTRAALAAAALEVVAEKGFAAASLDEIAARAGMTKGAVYSNFRSKGELLLAAMQRGGFSLRTRLPPEATLRERLDEMAEELIALTARARDEARFLFEFQLYALGDPDLQAEVAQMYAETFAGGAAFFAGIDDLKPGLSTHHLAVAIQSMVLGLTLQAIMSPEEVTSDAIRAAMDALADGVVRPG
jgi:AcrR family transcriptional regulator